MVRGKGYLRGKADIEQLVVKSEGGTPVLIRDIARVEMAPDERRGLSELNGEGEVVSGIAMSRFGQNALEGAPRPSRWARNGLRPWARRAAAAAARGR